MEALVEHTAPSDHQGVGPNVDWGLCFLECQLCLLEMRPIVTPPTSPGSIWTIKQGAAYSQMPPCGAVTHCQYYS